MQNAAARFKIWSSKHNIWIYLIILLLLGIYALHKITTTDVLARIDAVLLYDKTVQAKVLIHLFFAKYFSTFYF